jgi:hypothetical protein
MSAPLHSVRGDSRFTPASMNLSTHASPASPHRQDAKHSPPCTPQTLPLKPARWSRDRGRLLLHVQTAPCVDSNNSRMHLCLFLLSPEHVPLVTRTRWRSVWRKRQGNFHHAIPLVSSPSFSAVSPSQSISHRCPLPLPTCLPACLPAHLPPSRHELSQKQNDYDASELTRA